MNTCVSGLSVTIDGRSKAKAIPTDDVRVAVRDFLRRSGVSGSFKLWCPFRAGMQSDPVKVIPPKEEGESIRIHVRLGGRNDVYGVQLRTEEEVDQQELLRILEQGVTASGPGRRAHTKAEDVPGGRDLSSEVPEPPKPVGIPVLLEEIASVPVESVSVPTTELVRSHFTPGWFRDPELVGVLLQFIAEWYPESREVLRDDFIEVLRACTGFKEPIDLALVVKQLKHHSFIDIIREAGEWRTKSYRLYVERIRAFIRGEAVIDEGPWENPTVSEEEARDLAGDATATEVRSVVPVSLRDLLSRHDEMKRQIVDAFRQEIATCSTDLETMRSELAEYERSVGEMKAEIGEKERELEGLRRQLSEYDSDSSGDTEAGR